MIALVVVRFDGVVKSFGSTQALRGASFSVPSGCVAGLIGPNGAGKTTSLKICNGLLRRDFGRVEVFGYDPWVSPREVRALTGFLPESPRLPSVNVWKLLAHIARIKVGAGIEREVRRVARLSGAESVLSKVASKLSAGFRQRVALAMALVGEPKLLILDEPASNLDPRARADLYNLIKDLRRDYGVSILLSTHILAEARDVVDYLIIINKGLIVTEGWTAELARSVGLVVKAVFKVGRGVKVRELVNELISSYGVEGVRIKGDELIIEASPNVMSDVKEYLKRRGFKLVEEGSVDLMDLYSRLAGG